MNKLYPITFNAILKDKIWGGTKMKTVLDKDFSPLPNCGESWEISGVQHEISHVANGFLEGNSLQELIEVYMGDLVGEKVYETFGIEFPLLIKFIDAADYLSIQVHPDDALAKKRHQAYGKTEMWYVIEADPGAEIIAGFNRDIDRESYLKHLNNGTLKEILNIEKTRPGDVFFMPAGRIHAIGAGVLLAEIQQTSDVTYRIYDWDRLDEKGKSRELHTDLALDAIDYNHYEQYKTDYRLIPNEASRLVDCKYFTTNVIEMDQSLERNYNQLDSFVIYICLQGNLSISDEHGSETPLKTGETLLLPNVLEEIKLHPAGKVKLLEVYIK